MKRTPLMSLLTALLLSTGAFAQDVSNQSGRTRGSFEMTAKGAQPATCTYLVFGAAPANVIITLLPGREAVLTGRVVNADGKELMAMQPETLQPGMRHVTDIDASRLAPGAYFFEAAFSTGGTHRIPFTKE